MDDLFSLAPAPKSPLLACNACGHVHTSACEVVTVDGEVVGSYSEAWRVECEAHSILAQPLWQRKGHLDRIEKFRGKAAADQLKDRMWAIFQAEKKKAA